MLGLRLLARSAVLREPTAACDARARAERLAVLLLRRASRGQGGACLALARELSPRGAVLQPCRIAWLQTGRCRATYNALSGFSNDNSPNPFEDSTFPRDQTFVDELSCIGCGMCVRCVLGVMGQCEAAGPGA